MSDKSEELRVTFRYDTKNQLGEGSVVVDYDLDVQTKHRQPQIERA